MTDELLPIVLKSTAFRDGQRIPEKHTADGEDVSPPLSWSGTPRGTVSQALVCEDPDAPRGTWSHWVVYNLPAEARQLPEALPPDAAPAEGAAQGKNDFGKPGYGGPSPPPGKPHRYFFKLYALNTRLDLPPGATREQLEQAARGHVLGEGYLVGTYGRRTAPPRR
jgi:Raf kinase inhibitor-like YbhB/YbcL family protein